MEKCCRVVLTGGPGGGNPIRIETNDEALVLDRKLKALWSQHPRFVFVPHNPSFIKKIYSGLEDLAKIVKELK